MCAPALCVSNTAKIGANKTKKAEQECFDGPD